MKKIIKILISLLVLVLLVACGRKTSTSNSYNNKEVLLLVLSKKEKIEGVCGKDIWSTIYSISGEDYSFEELFLEDMNSFTIELYILTEMAKEENLLLDTKDEEKLKNISERYFEELNKSKISELANIDKDSLYTLFTAYTKALKMKEKLLAQSGLEISENEARVVLVDRFSFDDEVSAKNAKESLDKNEEIDTNLTYFLDKDVKLKRGEYSGEIENEIFSLENSQISDIIKSSGKYYIYKMVNSYDEISTKENKKHLLNEKSLSELSRTCYDFAKKRHISVSKDLEKYIKENISDDLDIKNFFDFYEENFDVSN